MPHHQKKIFCLPFQEFPRDPLFKCDLSLFQHFNVLCIQTLTLKSIFHFKFVSSASF